MPTVTLDGLNVDGNLVKFNASNIIADIGSANGIPSLDATGRIPYSQMPAGSSEGGGMGTYSGLEGKKVVFFGDSVSYGEGNNGHSYIDIINEMGICASLVKEAHTSSTVGPYNVFHDADGLDLLAMITLRTADIRNADVVFCGYCGNDSDSLAHNLVPLGKPSDAASVNSICGYTRRAIQNIRAINPLVRIVWMFSMMCDFSYIPSADSYVQIDYMIPTIKAMAEVCSDCNVTYGSQYDGLYLNKQSGHILNDTAGHPTELGHMFIAETILHEFPFSIRPYNPVKIVNVDSDGSYDSTFPVLHLCAESNVDITVRYEGLIFKPETYSNNQIVFNAETVTSSSSATRYILTITPNGANMYTTTSSITALPWSGASEPGYETLYNGNATIISDNPNYAVVNNFNYAIQQNDTWRFTWNGTEYSLESWYDGTVSNSYVFGNPGAVDPSGDDGSGVPFLAYKRNSTQLAFATSSSAGSISLKVERYTGS